MAWIMVVRGSPVPPWRQLAAILRYRIESGELEPGAQLPSALALAGQYGVSVPTVNKALRSLKADGLVTGVAGYGTFVAAELPAGDG